RLRRSLGLVALAAGRHELAVESLGFAFGAAPADEALARQLADLLVARGEHARAADVLARCADAIGSGDLDLLAGNLLQQAGRLPDAVRAYERAAGRTPASIAALSNLASTLALTQRRREARAVFERAAALAVAPADGARFAHAYGRFLQDEGDIEGATRLYETAISLAPATPAYRRTFAAFLLTRREAPIEAAWHVARALEADPSSFDDSPIADLPAVLMSQLYVVAEASGQRRLAARWAAALGPMADAPRPHDPGPRRLRVGYVSGDFRSHAVANFILPVLKAHDRRRFEIIGYSHGDRPDEVTARCRQACDTWCEAATLDDEALAARIRDDRVDVLVDLMGHSGGSRLALFHRRPAPVQVTWLGYPGTTGLSCFDARLVDSITDPPGMTDADFTEPLLRLPTPFVAYAPLEAAPSPDVEPAAQRETIVFGCFNNAAKITIAILRSWAAILRGVPGSRLQIKSGVTGNPHIVAELRRMAVAAGIPVARLDIIPPTPDARAHLAAYRAIDIALDCFPYNGTTTTCEALAAGVPVVTRAGRTHVSRVCASILTHAGMGDLVAADDESFVAIATRLALGHRERPTERVMRAARFAASPVCDAIAVTAAIEAAYAGLWERRCAESADA
ncbi:MAG: hypothetical protein FJX57_04185, partial [Alphaproteobacteria bacterium]|nr:hypothetical protein [Alphaproteobacteria bacterium]